jgi:hypothetical protein
MSKETWFNREVFLSMAEMSGLDTQDPHMDELYDYAREVLPGLRRIEELDLTGIEPVTPLISLKE